MKSFFVVLLFSLVAVTSFAQNPTELDSYTLKTQEDYVNAEPKVIESATFLFSTPIKKDDVSRLTATQFILRWMEGTDYTFNIDAKMTELTDGNNDLFGMYLAGMAKVVIESETQLSDEEVNTKVTDMLIAYCKDEKNNCKPTKKMKKLMKG